MFFGLRPVPESFWSSEQLLDPFGSKGGQLPVDIGLPSRATARRLIDHIDSIALTDEEIRPARSPIGRSAAALRHIARERITSLYPLVQARMQTNHPSGVNSTLPPLSAALAIASLT
jgi:hypothetical protein